MERALRKLTRFAVISGVVLFLTAQPTQAGPLGLTSTNPDLMATGLDITYTYDGTFGTLSAANATTWAATTFSLLDKDGNTVDTPELSSFQLTATLNGAGALQGGTFAFKDAFSNVLFGGTLTQFGLDYAYDAGAITDTGIFEFLANVDPTAWATDRGFGSQVGMKLNSLFIPVGGDPFSINGSGPSFQGFDADFSAIATSSDTFAHAVPEPATMLLLGSGSLVAFAKRRRRSRER